MEDKTAIVVYNRGTDLTTNQVETIVRNALPRNVETPRAIAQFYDLQEDMELQKWLICFEQPESVTNALANREWATLAGKPHAQLTVGPCKGPAKAKSQEPPPSSERINSTAKDKKRGKPPRGRGK